MTKHIICLAILTIVFIPNTTFAETPTKAETEEFITNNINGCKDIESEIIMRDAGGHTGFFTFKVDQTISFQNSKITFIQKWDDFSAGTGLDANHSESNDVLTLTLKDLDPANIKIGNDSLDNDTFQETTHPTIELQCSSNNCISDKDNSLVIYLCSEDVAPRLKKAFGHLIELSGGKASPF